MSPDPSIHERLSRISLNLIPLPVMARHATRKSDREELSQELLRIKALVFGLVYETDPRRETEVMPDKAIIRHIHEMLTVLIKRHIEVRETAISAGTDPDQIADSASQAAACEMLLAMMQAFGGLEITDA